MSYTTRGTLLGASVSLAALPSLHLGGPYGGEGEKLKCSGFHASVTLTPLELGLAIVLFPLRLLLDNGPACLTDGGAQEAIVTALRHRLFLYLSIFFFSFFLVKPEPSLFIVRSGIILLLN
ncbi:hypothetical protein VTO42DRAFT_1261 [Malbranchea cinnamomea]